MLSNARVVLTPLVYEVVGGGGVTIQKRSNNNWSVVSAGGGLVLNKDSDWEHEPSPSSRTDEFIERTRYPSPTVALEHWRKCAGKL